MTQTQEQLVEGTCPSCTTTVSLEDPLLGELVDCPGCDAELEVRATEPVTLALAPEIQEDWGE